jgi:hypothetical protein
VLSPQPAQADQVQQFVHPPPYPILRPAPALQAIPDVLARRQIGKKGIGLKHDAHIALGHRQPGNIPTLDAHPAAVQPFQPRDHAQQSGFAAPAGTEDAEKLPLRASKETASTAVNAPNRRVTFSTAR